jgi:hypothetical protein
MYTIEEIPMLSAMQTIMLDQSIDKEMDTNIPTLEHGQTSATIEDQGRTHRFNGATTNQ